MLEDRLHTIDAELYHLHPDSQAAEGLEKERQTLIDSRLIDIEQELNSDFTTDRDRRELIKESLRLRGISQ